MTSARTVAATFARSNCGKPYRFQLRGVCLIESPKTEGIYKQIQGSPELARELSSQLRKNFNFCKLCS